MQVRIETTSWLKKFTGDKTQIDLDIQEGTLAYDAVVSTGIPRKEIGFITIGTSSQGDKGNMVAEDYILKEGDQLKVYPPIIGG